jgi:hypothetical protein
MTVRNFPRYGDCKNYSFKVVYGTAARQQSKWLRLALKVVSSIYGTRGTRRGKVWLSRIVDTIWWKVKTCRVRTVHGFREIEGQKTAAVKLTALALLVLIWHPQNWRGARLLHVACVKHHLYCPKSVWVIFPCVLLYHKWSTVRCFVLP